MEIATGLALSGIAFTFFWVSNIYRSSKVGLFEVMINLGHIFALAALSIISSSIRSSSIQFSDIVVSGFSLLLWVYFFIFVFMFIKMWRNLITFVWRTRTFAGYIY